MLDASPGLPPHIALLLNEEFDLNDPRSCARKLKGMLPDLKDQARLRHSFELTDEDKHSGEFRAVLSGGLDLFGREGACQAPRCRVSYASQIARSIALMADQVVASDSLCHTINLLKSRSRMEEFIPLLSDVAVLKRIKPLISAGIFRFSPAFGGICTSCASSFDERIDQLTDVVIEKIGDSIRIESSGKVRSIGLGSIYNPEVHLQVNEIISEGKNDAELIRYAVRVAIQRIFLDARHASRQGGSVFSNSNAGISALLSEDGKLLDSWDLRAFSAERSADLPWISGLTIEQTLQLRSEAQSALPVLREFLARKISAEASYQSRSNWIDTVAELREQAAAVRSELKIVMSRSRTIKRNATGILGLCVSAACLATQGGEAALGGLVGTLGLIHSLPESNSTHAQEIKSRPGYVLVAAEDILRHAD